MSKCGAICEVFSRVCGYFRPVTNWNKGKQEEFKERKVFEVKGKKGFRGEEICTKKSGRQIVRWCVTSAAE